MPIDRLRQDHPDPDAITNSLRTGWDPQGMDPDEIAAERVAFEEAGVQYVISAPWRSDQQAWLESMEQLAAILGLT